MIFFEVELLNFQKACSYSLRQETLGHKKRVSYLYRTATTSYPCYVPVLGEFWGSWSYKTYPVQKYKCFRFVKDNTVKFII